MLQKFKTRKAAAALIAALAAVLLLGGSAGLILAAPVALGFDVDLRPSGGVWTNITNGFTSSDLDLPAQQRGFGITDADVESIVFLGDAYDDFHGYAVDGDIYSNQDNDDVDRVDTAAGTTVTTDVDSMSGLNTNLQYFFDADTKTVRVLLIFTNPTGTTINATIRYGGDFGSNGGTTVVSTSDSDTTFTTADRWSITDQPDCGGGPCDPINTIVWYGFGSPAVTPSVAKGVAGDSTWWSDYPITVPAGETVRLMMFGSMATSRAEATAFSATYDNQANLEASGLLEGLSDSELESIVNWDLGSSSAVLTIVKQVNGTTPIADWHYSGALGNFSIPAGGGSVTFADLAPGSYDVNELAQFSYGAQVSCTNGASGGDSVSVNLVGDDEVTCTFVNTLNVCDNILDDFNRPEHEVALGPNWTGKVTLGNYTLFNASAGEVQSGGPAHWAPGSFGVDQEACVRITKVDNNGHQTVTLKTQPRADSSPNWNKGLIAVFYNNEGDPIVGVETYVPGQGWTTLATWPMTLNDGDQLAGHALSDGTIRVFVNGTHIGDAFDPFFANKGGHIGVWFIGYHHALFDDFAGK